MIRDKKPSCPMIDSYFDIPLSSNQQSPPPSVPYSPAYSDPGSTAGSTRTGSRAGTTPAYSDEEVDVDEGNRLRSQSYRRTKRRRHGPASKDEVGSIGGLGKKLGMTGIVPLTTRTRSAGQGKWKEGRRAPGGIDSIEILTEDDDENDDPDADDEGGNVTPAGPTWGSHIVIEQGALLLTTSAAWEEAFHPTFGLMRRGRGARETEDEEETDEGVKGILTDERLETIGDEVEWLVLDLRIVLGEEEYRTKAEVMGEDEAGPSTQPTVKSFTRRSHPEVPQPAERTTSHNSISSNQSSGKKNPNPTHLPKVHKLTFLGSEYAEIMSPSRATMVREVVKELKGLLAVEW